MKTDEKGVERTLSELEARTDALKAAMDELYGVDEPSNPVGLVRCIRMIRSDIRRLLDKAEALGSDAPLVRRLRAAYPRLPAR